MREDDNGHLAPLPSFNEDVSTRPSKRSDVKYGMFLLTTSNCRESKKDNLFSSRMIDCDVCHESAVRARQCPKD